MTLLQATKNHGKAGMCGFFAVSIYMNMNHGNDVVGFGKIRMMDLKQAKAMVFSQFASTLAQKM